MRTKFVFLNPFWSSLPLIPPPPKKPIQNDVGVVFPNLPVPGFPSLSAHRIRSKSHTRTSPACEGSLSQQMCCKSSKSLVDLAPDSLRFTPLFFSDDKMIEFEGKTLQLWIFSKRVCENMCEYIDSVNQKEKHPPLDSKVIFQVKLEEVLLRHQQQEESV